MNVILVEECVMIVSHVAIAGLTSVILDTTMIFADIMIFTDITVATAYATAAEDSIIEIDTLTTTLDTEITTV
ncbi:hypothetical protein [Halalkalibacter alkaliphilus]|uniref:Uncharacterized protein n=1 Tax=Halalkalibacter alkaliphilus TaxID=2917993 RepID=A0A9X1ZV82_9BACI|nr:hypothetical protein [Halalkalibacter alkaliphilus]MCL7746119.1 hypothetical protein [Halalkalibacter alkaliphilus]